MADPDFQTLRLFLAVHDLGNVTRAAERNNIAVSAVTKRLQDLEAHYQVRLFERQARGVVPTPAGDELARHARDLFARVDRIKGIMGEFATGIRGYVRVHASASIIVEQLADVVGAFAKANPMIRVDMHEAMSWSIVRNVLEGRADIGLVAASVEIPPELTVYPYRSDQLVAALPQDHPLAGQESVEFEQLLDYEHVGIGASSALTVQLGEAAARLHRSVRHSYQVATCEVARRMVGAGLGIAILPGSMVIPFQGASGVRGIPLSDEWARREKRICVREDLALTVPVRLFLATLLED